MSKFPLRLILNRFRKQLPFAAMLFLVVGCNMTGSWRTISVDPPDAEFPISRLTLNADHRFTATGPIQGETRTRFGKYRVGFASLHLENAEGSTETYGVSGRAGETYELKWREPSGERPVTAVIARE